MAPPLPFHQVSCAELCRMFNENRYAERARVGEFMVRVTRDGHPSPERSGEPDCTRSQILAYFDGNGQKVALVHQYLRPDGSLGGSGMQDPKVLYVDGVLYSFQAPHTG